MFKYQSVLSNVPYDPQASSLRRHHLELPERRVGCGGQYHGAEAKAGRAPKMGAAKEKGRDCSLETFGNHGKAHNSKVFRLVKDDTLPIFFWKCWVIWKLDDQRI